MSFFKLKTAVPVIATIVWIWKIVIEYTEMLFHFLRFHCLSYEKFCALSTGKIQGTNLASLLRAHTFVNLVELYENSHYGFLLASSSRRLLWPNLQLFCS